MNKPLLQKNNNGGFALILALIASSVALAVGLSLLDITVKQLTLTSTARESEIAFQAAAAGINCIQTARNRYDDYTQVADAPTFDVECLNQKISMSDKNADDQIQKFEVTNVDWTTPKGLKLCIQMELMVLNAAEPVREDVTGTASNGVSKTCTAGDVCTYAFSRGHNRSCSEISSGILFPVQRELTAEF